jgi:hypothetical protein
MPYYLAAPIRETGDVITRTPIYAQFPTYAPMYKNHNFFLVHKYLLSPETHHLVPVLAPVSLVFKEATCKGSTIKGLLYAHETLIFA